MTTWKTGLFHQTYVLHMTRLTLHNLLSKPARIDSSSLYVTMETTPAGELDEGFDILGDLLYQVDPITGDSYVSQLALARRLARLGKTEEAAIAQDSLSTLYLSKQGEVNGSSLSSLRKGR